MSQKKPNKATRAIGYAVEAGAQLWHDPDADPYIDVLRDDDARCTLRVRSRACRTWLSGLMFSQEGKALGGQASTDAVDVLTAMAVHDGPEREVHVRLAHHDGLVYLDLGDSSWDAIRIAPSGWEVVSAPPVRFRRPRGLRPLPRPIQGADGWADLHGLLHEPADRDWRLLVGWLVGTLHPSGPYPILALTGEQGSAKTTVGRLLRSAVDPSEALLRSPPREDRELVIAARNSHVLGLDNLSRIPDWLSDALCRIATGGGYSARELYTDGEEVVFSDRRPIILTSIEDVATRGDLADRTIPVELPRIPEGARRPEREVYARMDEIRPRLLASLLDAVSTGLRRLHGVHLERLPRMADFAEWVVACEPALPWAEGQFLDAHDDARDMMVETGIEADPVALATRNLLDDVGTWTGTASDLLAKLDARRDGDRPPRGWPETPQAMGGRMTRAAPLLRAAGWDFERGDGRDRRTYYLTPNKHGDATSRHGRHGAHDPRDHAGSEGDDPRDDGDEGADGRHEGRHAESPTATTDVPTRDDGDNDLQTCTTPADEPEMDDLFQVEESDG